MNIGNHIGINKNRILNNPAISANTSKTLNVLRKPSGDQNININVDPTGWTISHNVGLDRSRRLPFTVFEDPKRSGSSSAKFVAVQDGAYIKSNSALQTTSYSIDASASPSFTYVTPTSNDRFRFADYDDYWYTALNDDESMYIYTEYDQADNNLGLKRSSTDPNPDNKEYIRIIAVVRNDAGVLTIWQMQHGNIQEIIPFAPFRIIANGTKIQICGGMWNRIYYFEDVGAGLFIPKTETYSPIDGDISWTLAAPSERILSDEYEVSSDIDLWLRLDLYLGSLTVKVFGAGSSPVFEENVYWSKLGRITRSSSTLTISQYQVGGITTVDYGKPSYCRTT